MPGQQGYVFNKAGLGYNTKGQQQLYENFFASTKSCSTPFITCFYCGKTHHMHLLATWERIIVWIPQGATPKSSTQEPKKICVPRTKS